MIENWTKKLKPLLPYLAIILFFIAISCVYFSPVLQGKVLSQSDNDKAIGMAKELNDFQKETGISSQWTNSMFSGMPAYQIKGDSSANLFWYLNNLSRLGLPYTTIAIVFLYLMGFFLLLRTMGFNHWLSVAGAVAFGFGSYNFIIILAGHITKAYAIALMAPVLAGIIYTYNKNKWGGAIFTAIALGAEISYNHVQVSYYLALLVLLLVIERFIRSIFEKTLKEFAQRTGLLAIALVFAMLPTITNLWTTYEYGKYSMRGKSELKAEDNRRESEILINDGLEPEKKENTSGLDADYAFAWSYSKMETFTFLIPNLMGGGSKPISLNNDALKNVSPRMASYVGQQSQYWGNKPFTEGPVYVGAIVCFLFVLALYFYHGREKWWLLAGTVLAFMLSWGHNFEWFNMFMFNHFPLYNKFRTVEMALIIATVTIPLLAMLGLKAIIENPEVIKYKLNHFLWAIGITGGLAAIFYLIPDTFLSFISDYETTAIAEQKLATPEQAADYDMLMQDMATARRTILKSDALRSLIFILLGSGSIWLYASKKVAAKYILPAFIVLILFDLWGVDKRYISNDKFKPERQMRYFVQSNADKAIYKDNDKFFRVFSVYMNPFTEVNTSYFHSSIGGYHGAKLQRYQDVIDNYLMNSFQILRGMLQQGTSPEYLRYALSEMPVVNMLNVRYINYHPDMEPFRNPYSMGNAWFVKNIQIVNGVREELEALDNIYLNENAIIHSDFAKLLPDDIIGEIGGIIELTDYAPNKTVYKAHVGSPQLAVFSEIYYPAGWNAYINGNKVPHFRANYILRGLAIPAGESTIEFRFEPKSYKYGKTISFIGSALILIIAGLFIFYNYKRKDYKKFIS